MSLERFDFIFIYEHKVRELENICLMKYELDRRGYKTKIIYVEDVDNAIEPRAIYFTHVLCTMACYDNHTLYWHAKEFIRYEKVIDLQWENIVYSKDENREDAYKNYREIGKEVVHLSWGQQNVDRLVNVAHLNPGKVKLTGHVGMDFLRYPLSRYYISREELLKKYDISVDKKVILFASPYYGDNLPDSYISDMCMRFGDDWTVYYKFMCDSQTIVLDWFEKACLLFPDIIFVFRPHPGHPSLAALDLEKRVSNFRVISGESVKQWIIACDGIYTGNSSVVVEAFFAQKMCQLLFPIPITEGFELNLISHSNKISTYEEFTESLLNEKDFKDFPTPQKDIEQIYLIDWDRNNYVKFADMAEEVLHNRIYRLTRKQISSTKETSFVVRAISSSRVLYGLYLKMLENKKVTFPCIVEQRRLRETNLKHLEEDRLRFAHEMTCDKEINDIISRIRSALED